MMFCNCVAIFCFLVVLVYTELPPLTTITVEVPDALKTLPPFTVPKQLKVPQGFGVRVYARVPKARFILVLPSGEALVSQPKLGSVSLLQPPVTPGDPANVTILFEGLKSPHDMVWHRIGENEYLYLSESNAVARYLYEGTDSNGTIKFSTREVIVVGLPDESDFRHPLKNIAVHNDYLYVAIGSATNDSPDDLKRDPKRGAIYAYSLDGNGSRQLVSEGVRNAEGLAFAPETDNLWVVVNQRDDVTYPYHDGSNMYGKVNMDYVDEHPPEEFSRIEWGINYGWPFCNPEPSESMNDLTYVADAANNPNESVVDCSQFRSVDKGMEAHSAPLGLTFWTGLLVPEAFKNGALVGMHGSWNRRAFSGHKVAFFPWENDRPGDAYDLVTGWVTDAQKKRRWGRPVDTGVLHDGSLLITDDASGTVYHMYMKDTY